MTMKDLEIVARDMGCQVREAPGPYGKSVFLTAPQRMRWRGYKVARIRETYMLFVFGDLSSHDTGVLKDGLERDDA